MKNGVGLILFFLILSLLISLSRSFRLWLIVRVLGCLSCKKNVPPNRGSYFISGSPSVVAEFTKLSWVHFKQHAWKLCQGGCPFFSVSNVLTLTPS